MEWVKVSDKLPRDRTDVLGCRANAKHPEMTVRIYWYHSGMFYYAGRRDNMLTHWMPLPEPPK